MTGPVHISSLVIQVRPERLTAVKAEIETAGGDVPFEDPGGKLVAVIETDGDAAVTRFLEQASAWDGVLSATLAYHLIDDEEAGAAPEREPVADQLGEAR